MNNIASLSVVTRETFNGFEVTIQRENVDYTSHVVGKFYTALEPLTVADACYMYLLQKDAK